MSEKPKRKPGRPPSRTEPMQDIHITLTARDIAALDAYVEEHKMGRSEAIRLAVRLLTAGGDGGPT